MRRTEAQAGALEETAASIEQLTAAANGMDDQATQLQRLVASFVLDPVPRLALALENGMS